MYARERLTRLLPRLQASDVCLLNEEQRTSLYEELKSFLGSKEQISDERIAFGLAILKALEQIGDARAIPYVVAIANMSVNDGSRHPLIEAAQNCLPFLQARALQTEQAMTLLRASDPAATSPEELLRPATARSETPPQELLRSIAD